MSNDNNLETLCEHVFSKPLHKDRIVHLFLDKDIASEIPENKHATYIFEILVQILFGGIKILFGTNEEGKISLGSLTHQDFELLRKYFQIMEYDIRLDIYSENDSPDYRQYDPKDFSTLHLKFLKDFDGIAKYVDFHFVELKRPHEPVHVEVQQEKRYYSSGGELPDWNYKE